MGRKLQIIRIKEQRKPERSSSAAERAIEYANDDDFGVHSNWPTMVDRLIELQEKEKSCIYSY
mgnify:CR=1 FL=1